MHALEIKNLIKNYNKVEAVKGLNLTVDEGEFFGLLGPNGAGKSTTINIITGLANKTSGEVQVFGADVVGDYKVARSYIGLVPQEFNVDRFEKVCKILRFNGGYFGLDSQKVQERSEWLLKELRLWDKRNAKFGELSGGMKRKVMIARALLHEPKLLILDEPTAGVDVETRKVMWDFLRKINREEKITIILTTHYLEEAEALCERIVIINKGTIVANEKKRKLLELFEGEKVTVTLSEVKELPKSAQRFSPECKGQEVTFFLKKEEWPEFMKVLKGLPVVGMEVKKNSLEEVFLHVTQS